MAAEPASPIFSVRKVLAYTERLSNEVGSCGPIACRSDDGYRPLARKPVRGYQMGI